MSVKSNFVYGSARMYEDSLRNVRKGIGSDMWYNFDKCVKL